MIKTKNNRELRFAGGQIVPERLKHAYLTMQNQVGITGVTHALLEVTGKIYTIPCPSGAEVSLNILMQEMGGELHGSIISL